MVLRVVMVLLVVGLVDPDAPLHALLHAQLLLLGAVGLPGGLVESIVEVVRDVHARGPPRLVGQALQVDVQD